MNSKTRTTAYIVAAVLIIVGVVVATGLYRVGQGEQALVITFGEVTDTKGPGLYWHVPLAQQIISKSVSTIHNVEYGYRTTVGGTSRSAAAYSDVEEESVMLTNDNSIVQLEAIYQYTIRDVRQYVFDVEDPIRTMHLAFESIVRRNIQNRSLDDALLNKDSIEAEALPDFQALIDYYEMGVKINAVHIQNITVPSEVTASYEDVNNAKNEMTRRLDEAQQYENEILPLARSGAYEMEQSALAYKASEIAKAESEVAQFKSVLEKYKLSPGVSRTRMMIETMENMLAGAGKIVIVDSQSNVLELLDITDGTITTQGGETL